MKQVLTCGLQLNYYDNTFKKPIGFDFKNTNLQNKNNRQIHCNRIAYVDSVISFIRLIVIQL